MYDCDCDDCKTTPQTALNLGIGDNFKAILKKVEKAFKQLHKNGSYKPEDIGNVKAYQDLITETSNLLSSAIKDNDIPEAMLQSLKEDVFIFSGLKTHAQLLEASRLLLNDKGEIKSFNAFANDVNSIQTNYNQTYLEAEYQFAVSSAQMAGKWADISDDYHLQYRTAKDDKVRESHQALDEITLPADDAFWKSYYPPNGWRCRCNAAEVRKGKHEVSDPDAAIKAGEKATTQLDKDGKNKLAIFRFNPGAEKKVFPPAHPYSKVNGAKKVKSVLKDIDAEKDYNILNENERFKIEKESVLIREIDTIYKQLSKDETACIYMYTMPDAYFKYLNEYNRTEQVGRDAKANGFNKETLDAMTRVVNRGLDKIPDRHEGLVYRGTDLNREQFKAYEDALSNNKPYLEKGFLSTTTEKKRAFDGNTSYIIKAKNGAYIAEIAAINEEEVLFKSKQEFKVTKIENEKGKNIIYMEEI